jgi:predicted nucleic acid-binding Zn ribbon protein
MRRPAPRPLSDALARALPDARPPGLLAEVQSAWPEIAGAALAEAATPVGQHEGVVTVGCESAVWAQELELLGPDLLTRLNARLEQGEVARLRFVVGPGPKREG